MGFIHSKKELIKETLLSLLSRTRVAFIAFERACEVIYLSFAEDEQTSSQTNVFTWFHDRFQQVLFIYVSTPVSHLSHFSSSYRYL